MSSLSRLAPVRQGRGDDFGLRQMLADLLSALRIGAGWSRFRLLWWVASLHLRPVRRPLCSSEALRLPVRAHGKRLRLLLRKNQSDLYVFAEVFLRELYGEALDRLDMPVRTVVDLGANIGLVTLLLQSRFPQARVVCVEPVAESVVCLRENMRANGLTWEVFPTAVADSPGRKDLFVSRWWSSSTTSGSVRDKRFRDLERADARLRLPTRSVEAVSVEMIKQRCGFERIDVLKVDVEGAEAELLHDEASWLLDVGAVLLELHEKYVDPQPVLATLRRFGFHRVALSSPHVLLFQSGKPESSLPGRTAVPA